MDEFPMHRESDLERVKQLIEGGESVNSLDDRGRTPLHWAAEKGRYEVVDFLSSLPECNLSILDHEGRNPVMVASLKRENSIVDLLFQRGARGTAGICKWTPLHDAAEEGCVDKVCRILDRGEADVNAATWSGDTPLTIAVSQGHEDVTAVLIRAGADVNQSTAEKKTALHYAARKCMTGVVRMLLEKEELELNPRDDCGRTPLHWACYWGWREVIEQLLAAGADINLKHCEGDTALSYGLSSNRLTLEGIRFLIQQGAYLQHSDNEHLSYNPLLKERLVKDVSICTQSIVNKFHCQSLPALSSISYFARKLPSIDKFKLKARQIDEVENWVRCEIERYTFCDVFEAHPMALSALCVQSLITCQSGVKRSASPDFGDSRSPLKKFRYNIHSICNFFMKK